MVRTLNLIMKPNLQALLVQQTSGLGNEGNEVGLSQQGQECDTKNTW